MNAGPTVRLGLSSGTVPAMTAAELAAFTRSLGGTVVDLRAGKGHAWERDGVAALGGLAVAFVGLSVVLGEDPEQPAAVSDIARRFEGLPVKVFAARGASASRRAREQLAALTGTRTAADVLVETHRGGAGPKELAELCSRHGTRLVIDNLGLHEISRDVEADLAYLAPLARAVQVKGFGAGGRHRPLAEEDLSWSHLFAEVGVDVTVESRAGTPEHDLSVLARAWKALPCACPSSATRSTRT
ncbi:hypothetical protein [Thermoactinospora rubra]|uniref:hypothetical protein n=1 Tax=Thermoactinospora rubra TaxID=1088767 RepID=UPI000A10A35C|nr:hypothetical protein [Thermoactinospora rubra]